MQISVVIPCYNAQAWIADSLRSVAEQDTLPHEIIVVDDGSTDGSVEAIQQSGVELQLVRTQRANGAGARNAGVEVAVGDWIAFHDADDLWLPNHLTRVVRLLGATSDVAYLGHCVTFRDAQPDLRTAEPLGWPIDEPRRGLTHIEFIEMYGPHRRFTMPSTVVHRERLLEVGGFDTELVRRHDIDMWLRVIADRTWSLDPVPTVAYRRDAPGSISRSVANAALYYLQAILKNRSAYPTPAMDDIVRQLARSAVSSAITFGGPADRAVAIERAWPYVAAKDKLPLTLGCYAPRLFATLHRWRNRRLPAYSEIR